MALSSLALLALRCGKKRMLSVAGGTERRTKEEKRARIWTLRIVCACFLLLSVCVHVATSQCAPVAVSLAQDLHLTHMPDVVPCLLCPCIGRLLRYARLNSTQVKPSAEPFCLDTLLAFTSPPRLALSTIVSAVVPGVPRPVRFTSKRVNTSDRSRERKANNN